MRFHLEKLFMRKQRGYPRGKWIIENSGGDLIAKVYENERLAQLIVLLPAVGKALLDAGNLILLMAQNFDVFNKYHKAMLHNAGELRSIIDMFKPETVLEPHGDHVKTEMIPLKQDGGE